MMFIDPMFLVICLVLFMVAMAVSVVAWTSRSIIMAAFLAAMYVAGWSPSLAAASDMVAFDIICLSLMVLFLPSGRHGSLFVYLTMIMVIIDASYIIFPFSNITRISLLNITFALQCFTVASYGLLTIALGLGRDGNGHKDDHGYLQAKTSLFNFNNHTEH